jgi:hypothetical protein
MDASEMGRKRWLNAQARWANATEHDFQMARDRARAAREARTKKLIAQKLGVNISKLSLVKVKLVTASKFRKEKSKEQKKHWRDLRKTKARAAKHIQSSGARQTSITYPARFSLIP